ncbi:MAG: carbohydrate porin [Pseudomonadota bacterium]
MVKIFFWVAVLAASAVLPASVSAAEEQTLARMRAELEQLKNLYEARLVALERRLQVAEQRTALPAASEVSNAPERLMLSSTATPLSAFVPNANPGANQAASSQKFNPDLSLILGGSYARLSQDPRQYRIQGFFPAGGEVGPGQRSFSLGESELSLAANVDPTFSGKLTFSLSADNQASVEEAFVQTQALANQGVGAGLKLQAGRFLSSLGYLNNQHAHVWDFVDVPLVYQAMFGGQYRPDGVQLTWLVPTDRFFELGFELSNGSGFPGTERNQNGAGATTAFAHIGDDLGENASWRVGLSHLQTRAEDRVYSDTVDQVRNAFSGKSTTWVLDGVYKWAPYGNGTYRNFKLQAEYFQRREEGTLTYDPDGVASALAMTHAPSGGYVQGVYQFQPQWRVGLRYDRLNAPGAQINFAERDLSVANFPLLSAYRPERSSLMFDYSPSEMSRLRIQFADDRASPGVRDKQLFLQYIMSMGAHGAHAF